MNWLIVITLSIIFFFTPYQRGLFFATDTYFHVAIISFMFLVSLIVLLFNKNQNEYPYQYTIIFLIPLMYLLSFFTAETPKGNFDYLLSWIMYASFFILLVWIKREEKIEKMLPFIFQFTGLSIAFFALAGLWGWITYQDIMLGDRLTGPFQYANTFAAVIVAFWLFNLITLTRGNQSYISIVLFSIPLVAYGVSFLHSYSRGVMLVFPLAWIIGLILLRVREQLLYVVYSAISVVSSFIVFRVIVEQNKVEEANNPGLFSFLFMTILVTALVVGIQYLNYRGFFDRILTSLSSRKYLRFALPVVIIGTVVLLWLDLEHKGLIYEQLPESLQKRVENITMETASALARTTMYSDALRMSKDSLLLGHGGDGWRILFTQYQSLPYWSTQVHNGYVEVLLNIGLLGLMVFLFVFIVLLYQIVHSYWQTRNTEGNILQVSVLSSLTILFLHSAIDFNFSYGTVWFVILWLMAMGVPRKPEILFSLREKLSWNQKQIVLGKNVFLSLLIIISLFGIGYAYKFHAAEQEMQKVRGEITFQKAEQIIKNALSYNPYHVDYRLQMANLTATLYRNTKEEKLLLLLNEQIKQAEELEPKNSKLLYNIGQLYLAIEDWEQASQYFDKALYYDRFNVDFINSSVGIKTKLAQQYNKEGNFALAKERAESAIDTYERYLMWYHEFKEKQFADRRPLKVERDTELDYIEANLLIGNYEVALDYADSIDIKVEPNMKMEVNGQVEIKPFKLLGLTDYLDQYSEQIIIISVMDEGARYLSNRTKQYLKFLGSEIDKLKIRDSYILILSDNRVIYEEIKSDSAILLHNGMIPELDKLFLNKLFEIYSAGYEVGNSSSIAVDGVEYSQNKRGMNIAVFDHNLNHIDSINFDTYLSDVIAVPLE